jgi:hypothetical protein
VANLKRSPSLSATHCSSVDFRFDLHFIRVKWTTTATLFCNVAVTIAGLRLKVHRGDLKTDVENRMRFRKLRIAFSAACAISCLLMIVFWVRSWDIQDSTKNWYGDEWKYEIPGQRIFKVLANRGAVRLSTARFIGYWTISVPEEDTLVLGFGIRNDPPSLCVRIPCWFLVALPAGLAAVPWFRWSNRFSLRTLLIATTLLAVSLGLAVYATRQ